MRTLLADTQYTMADILTNLGEEYMIKNDWRTTAVTFGMYNNATDLLSDTSDMASITTEPADGNYLRQSATISDTEVQSIGGDWGWVVTVQFDVTNTTGSVDACFAMVNFTAEETADAGATDHLVAAAFLSQTRDLANYDTIDVTFELPVN